MLNPTPGTWEATGNDDAGYAIHAHAPTGLVQVAEINPPYTPGYDRYAADARLIAASPAVLEALRVCVAAFNTRYHQGLVTALSQAETLLRDLEHDTPEDEEPTAAGRR
jgi:hypothetical protein